MKQCNLLEFLWKRCHFKYSVSNVHKPWIQTVVLFSGMKLIPLKSQWLREGWHFPVVSGWMKSLLHNTAPQASISYSQGWCSQVLGEECPTHHKAHSSCSPQSLMEKRKKENKPELENTPDQTDIAAIAFYSRSSRAWRRRWSTSQLNQHTQNKLALAFRADVHVWEGPSPQHFHLPNISGLKDLCLDSFRVAKKRSDVNILQLPPPLVSSAFQTEAQLKEINHYVAVKKKKKRTHIPHNRHQCF